MTAIDKARLEKYRALADRDLWDIDDPAFREFYARAQGEGVDLVSNNFSTLGMFRAPHRKSLEGVDIALAGIPMDIGVPNPRPGTRLGPRELRYWSLDRNLVHYLTRVCPFDLCSIIDWGDVEFEVDAYSLDANLETICRVYDSFKDAGISPLSIGGEHTCTYGILKALSARGDEPLALIHLDAHADTSVGFGGTRISDATLFQVATVDGFIDPERTVQVGLRGRGLPRADFSHASGMQVILADEVHAQGIAPVLQTIHEVIGDRPCYLSIDTDVLDCAVMPGTTLPEPFGLSGLQVREVILGIRDLNIVGADLMELSPPWDAGGMSACLASGLAFEMLCLLAECHARRSGRTRPTHWRE